VPITKASFGLNLKVPSSYNTTKIEKDLLISNSEESTIKNEHTLNETICDCEHTSTKLKIIKAKKLIIEFFSKKRLINYAKNCSMFMV